MENTGSLGDPPDLTINFKGNKIRVHKSVLVESGEYFRAMLTKDFKEAHSSEVIIEYDVDIDVFQAILNYIYTGEIKWSTRNVEEITRAANYFMLENLYNSSFDFKVKHFELILKSDSFLTWDLASVHEVLRSDLVFVSDEKKVFIFAIKWLQYDFDKRRKMSAQLLQKVRFSRMTKQEMKELADENRQFVFGIPSELASSAPRQYHKGIYTIERDSYGIGIIFKRYCPVTGAVADLSPPTAVSHDICGFIVNNEQIYHFDFLDQLPHLNVVYDPMSKNWTDMSIKNDEIFQFCNGNYRNLSIVYCSFEKVIYAFAIFGSTMKVFCLEIASHQHATWVDNAALCCTPSGGKVIRATACGDSIYLVLSKYNSIFQCTPSIHEWTEIRCSYNLAEYEVVSYKTKLLFRICNDHSDKVHGRMLVYDTATTKFKEYFCYPGSTTKSHVTVYNDSIYFLPVASSQRSYGYGCKQPDLDQVQRLDETFMDEEISLIGPPVPASKVQLLNNSRVVSIQ